MGNAALGLMAFGSDRIPVHSGQNPYRMGPEPIEINEIFRWVVTNISQCVPPGFLPL